MPRTRFCSACGEKIPANRARTLAWRRSCAACRRPAFTLPAAWFIILTVCSVASFTFGRYTAPAKPFNFIGTPVEPGALASSAQPAKATLLSSPNPSSATSTEAFITTCEAPTKAGHPCRRKVHGWGYCWQHRDKFGNKPLPKAPELVNKIEQAGSALP